MLSGESSNSIPRGDNGLGGRFGFTLPLELTLKELGGVGAVCAIAPLGDKGLAGTGPIAFLAPISGVAMDCPALPPALLPVADTLVPYSIKKRLKSMWYIEPKANVPYCSQNNE